MTNREVAEAFEACEVGDWFLQNRKSRTKLYKVSSEKAWWLSDYESFKEKKRVLGIYFGWIFNERVFQYDFKEASPNPSLFTKVPEELLWE